MCVTCRLYKRNPVLRKRHGWTDRRFQFPSWPLRKQQLCIISILPPADHPAHLSYTQKETLTIRRPIYYTRELPNSATPKINSQCFYVKLWLRETLNMQSHTVGDVTPTQQLRVKEHEQTSAVQSVRVNRSATQIRLLNQQVEAWTAHSVKLHNCFPATDETQLGDFWLVVHTACIPFMPFKLCNQR